MEINNQNFTELPVLDMFFGIANGTKTRIIIVGIQQLYAVDVERGLVVLLVLQTKQACSTLLQAKFVIKHGTISVFGLTIRI